MNEPRRLLEDARSPLARQLLEAGLAETPAPAARARTWRACAGEELGHATTFDGSARSLGGTMSRALNLVRLPHWMRRGSVRAAGAALALACGVSVWFLNGGVVPAASHYASEAQATAPSEKQLLDRAEYFLIRGQLANARRELARYRAEYPIGASSARADSLELQAEALTEGTSMDTQREQRR